MHISSETIERLLEKRGAYPQWAPEYGEPGYNEAPANGIIFADWNQVNKRVYAWLEKHGFALEWSDEWTVIWDNDGKAYRTSPDCYQWRPY